MKNRGFTLIEIVASLAILSILLLVNVKGYKYYKIHVQKINDMSYLYETRDILSFAREYCYENEVYGEVYFDNTEELSKIYFEANDRVIKSINFQGEYRLKNSNFIINNKRVLKIDIYDNGYIMPGTIEIGDSKNKIFKIIIRVGGNLVYIKDE